MDVNRAVTKREFDQYRAPFPDLYDVEDTVRWCIDSLLAHLYRPVDDHTWRSDGRKLRKFGLDNEAINWGDLSCTEVNSLTDGSFLAVIEEASPDCVNLCRWVEGWLMKWGWKVKVQTEW